MFPRACPLLVQGTSDRGLGPAFRGLLPLPSSAPGFDLVRGGFVFCRLVFVFGRNSWFLRFSYASGILSSCGDFMYVFSWSSVSYIEN